MNNNVNSALAKAGMTKENVRRIMDEVEVNYERLDRCPAHAFELIEGGQPLRNRYACKVCGGEVDNTARFWYTKGLEHGRRFGK